MSDREEGELSEEGEIPSEVPGAPWDQQEPGELPQAKVGPVRQLCPFVSFQHQLKPTRNLQARDYSDNTSRRWQRQPLSPYDRPLPLPPRGRPPFHGGRGRGGEPELQHRRRRYRGSWNKDRNPGRQRDMGYAGPTRDERRHPSPAQALRRHRAGPRSRSRSRSPPPRGGQMSPAVLQQPDQQVRFADGLQWHGPPMAGAAPAAPAAADPAAAEKQALADAIQEACSSVGLQDVIRQVTYAAVPLLRSAERRACRLACLTCCRPPPMQGPAPRLRRPADGHPQGAGLPGPAAPGGTTLLLLLRAAPGAAQLPAAYSAAYSVPLPRLHGLHARLRALQEDARVGSADDSHELAGLTAAIFEGLRSLHLLSQTGRGKEMGAAREAVRAAAEHQAALLTSAQRGQLASFAASSHNFAALLKEGGGARALRRTSYVPPKYEKPQPRQRARPPSAGKEGSDAAATAAQEGRGGREEERPDPIAAAMAAAALPRYEPPPKPRRPEPALAIPGFGPPPELVDQQQQQQQQNLLPQEMDVHDIRRARIQIRLGTGVVAPPPGGAPAAAASSPQAVPPAQQQQQQQQQVEPPASPVSVPSSPAAPASAVQLPPPAAPPANGQHHAPQLDEGQSLLRCAPCCPRLSSLFHSAAGSAARLLAGFRACAQLQPAVAVLVTRAASCLPLLYRASHCACSLPCAVVAAALIQQCSCRHVGERPAQPAVLPLPPQGETAAHAAPLARPGGVQAGPALPRAGLGSHTAQQRHLCRSGARAGRTAHAALPGRGGDAAAWPAAAVPHA